MTLPRPSPLASASTSQLQKRTVWDNSHSLRCVWAGGGLFWFKAGATLASPFCGHHSVGEIAEKKLQQ